MQPRFDYLGLFGMGHGLCNHLNYKLQKLQNNAARVILTSNYEVSYSSLLEILKLDRLTVKGKNQKLAPVYLRGLFSKRATNYKLSNSVN